MIRVGLARCRASYEGLSAPWGPGKSYPELDRLLGEESGDSPFNEVYAAVRASLHGLGLDDVRAVRYAGGVPHVHEGRSVHYHLVQLAVDVEEDVLDAYVVGGIRVDAL